MSDSSNTTNNKNRKKQHVKDNIKVAIRCRPLLSGEKSLCELVCNSRKNQIGVVIPRNRVRDSNKLYTFDKIYDTTTKQNDLFLHSIEPIITDVLLGYNCTVFAYGQTGSGKTYTMEGIRFDNHNNNNHNNHNNNNNNNNDEFDGIIPRAIKSIFYQLERDQIESTVIVSHLEIYNEELTDLLCDLGIKKKKLTIYNDIKRNKCLGVFVQGLEEIIVSSAKQIFDILCKSTAKRKTAATNLNNRSSRSHCIFTITIRIKTVINTEEIVKTGTLNLVDLAGSESIARSGADKINDRAKEAGHINTSLLTLGRVISALVERRQHIPYRESKLTRLLQESLGGRNKTLLIATVSGYSPLDQTLNTLDYALRAKNIQNKPQLNVSMTKEKYVKELQLLLNNYKKQIEALRNEKGIILPPKQYENMTNKLEEQKSEIEKINTMFETEKNKLIEMNELFTKTNDKLNDTLKEKNGLITELNELSDKLIQITNELMQNKYVVNKYENNEKILREQAKNVKNVLEITIQNRDILCDKIETRSDLENVNSNQWNTKRDNIVNKLLLMQNNLCVYKKSYDTQFINNINCIKQVCNGVNGVMKMIENMNEFNINKNGHKINDMKELRNKYIINGLCNTQLKEYININKCNYENTNGIINGMYKEIIPVFVNDLIIKMKGLGNTLGELSDNLECMYVKQENERNVFMDKINDIIMDMNNEIELNENNNYKYLNEWKIEQENVMNECKEYMVNEMNRIYSDVVDKQMGLFKGKYQKYKQMIEIQNNKLNKNGLNNVKQVINKYNINENNNCKINGEKRKYLIDGLNNNIQHIENKTICDWNNKMNLGMNNLCETMDKSYKESNNYITNKIVNDLNVFNNKYNEYDKVLMDNINIQNENFGNVQNKLNKHILSLNNCNNNNEIYNKNNNISYFNTLSNNINNIKSESEKYKINKYKSTGETPTKQNIIYPTQFIETKPFEHLINEFNNEIKDENESYFNSDSISTHISSKSKSMRSKSSSPYFISDEIEINFNSNELGFRMYGGNKNKNGFIRHCHSDPRVCDNAQIIEIDGIDVIDKSIGYIRTLLATKQRPISIKFKNVINNNNDENGNGKSFLINDNISNIGTDIECESNGKLLDNNNYNQSKSLSASFVNINSRKRPRDIVRPKMHKLNYGTPHKKRFKKTHITSLSPISNVMDVDNTNDIE